MARRTQRPTRRSGIGKVVSKAAKAGTPLKKKTSRIARLKQPRLKS